jgi:glucose/arabinose dehydrogenase
MRARRVIEFKLFSGRRRTRSITLAVAGVLLASSGVGVDPVLAAPVLADGFSDEVVFSGLDKPSVVQFAANGHIFVAEKSGLIKRFDSVSDTSPVIVADLRDQVFNYWDKGLLGMAVHPQYPSKPYVYALYAHLRKGTYPESAWHRDSGNDTCPGSPAGPGSTLDGCVTWSRLSRLTLNANGVMASQDHFVRSWCGQFPSHSIGALGFARDGYLYAVGGEGASFNPNNLDYGQFGGTVIDPATNQPYVPRNPCADPPGGAGGQMTLPNAQGGSLRAQDKQTPSDAVGLSGTLIRIDPDTGVAAPDNPSIGSTDANDRRIIGYGLRNPFRLAFRPGTDEIWIGDVGSYQYEEINRHIRGTAPVRNYGWPCYEGSGRNAGWDNLNASICENLYAAGSSAVRAPYLVYPRNGKVTSADTCSITQGASVSGLAFYKGGSYPTTYNKALFIGDFSRRCIWAIRAGTDGLPDLTKLTTVVDGAGLGPVDLKIGTGGDVFYVDHDDGKIRRLVYSGPNRAPTIVATATPTSGPAPLEVQFDASGSSDPDPGDTLTITWDLDGDGQYDDASGATTSRTYAKGTHTPAVRVSDNNGASRTKSFTIYSGNEPPQPAISSPAASATWSVNQSINFSGSASDPEEGTLAGSRLTWRIILHHCSGSSCHEHLMETTTGNSGSFAAPDHDYPSHLELRLTAEDGAGAKATVSRSLQPKTVDLTFASDPVGLQVTAGGQQQPSPFGRRFIVGAEVALSAPTPQTLAGTSYAFASWSDGGARSHTIKAPSSNSTYTARFSTNLAPDAANSCGALTTNSRQGKWLKEKLSSGSDVDWYRFKLSEKGWVRIVLGALPRNYRLDLYSACGTRLASSDRSGKEFEEIYRQLAAGTYRVRVKSSTGKVDPQQDYALRFQRLGAGLRLLSSTSWLQSGTLHIHGEVLNNRGYSQRLVRVEATFYDAAGAVLGKQAAYTHVDVLRRRTRSPFAISAAAPKGYARYSLSVTGQRTEQAVVGKLAITANRSGTDADGLWLRGDFTNRNSYAVRSASSVATLYDAWGRVLNTARAPTTPTQIAAGRTGSFGLSFADHYLGRNRSVIQLQAKR